MIIECGSVTIFLCASFEGRSNIGSMTFAFNSNDVSSKWYAVCNNNVEFVQQQVWWAFNILLDYLQAVNDFHRLQLHVHYNLLSIYLFFILFFFVNLSTSWLSFWPTLSMDRAKASNLHTSDVNWLRVVLFLNLIYASYMYVRGDKMGFLVLLGCAQL